MESNHFKSAKKITISPQNKNNKMQNTIIIIVEGENFIFLLFVGIASIIVSVNDKRTSKFKLFIYKKSRTKIDSALNIMGSDGFEPP